MCYCRRRCCFSLDSFSSLRRCLSPVCFSIDTHVECDSKRPLLRHFDLVDSHDVVSIYNYYANLAFRVRFRVAWFDSCIEFVWPIFFPLCFIFYLLTISNEEWFESMFFIIIPANYFVGRLFLSIKFNGFLLEKMKMRALITN